MFKIKIISFIVLFSFICIACTGKQDEQNTSNKKAKWIANSYTSLKNREFPGIKAVSWWHERWENDDGSISDLRINSSSESLTAFQNMISDSLFVSTLTFVNNKLVPSSNSIYFGSFPDFDGPEDNVSLQRINNFESLAQKTIAWAYFSNNWYDSIRFPLQEVQTIHQAGRVPFIRMMARSSLEENVADPNYSMQNIIDGEFDMELLEWFQQAANVNYPILIEFGTEVNGEWFPWNGIHNGAGIADEYGDINLPDGPERFRDAYRHLVYLSLQAGATNLTWFFHIDSHGQPELNWNNFENYYPGDDYIDWIGVSVYGAITQDDEYEEFNIKLSRVYNRIKILTQKPLAILEMGITEDF